MLELEFVELSKPLGACEIGRLTFFFEFDLFAKCILQSPLDQIDREISDVDADPLSPEFLRRMNRRAASAKRIEHHIAGFSARLDNSFEQRQRLLGRKSKTLLRLRI